MSGDEESAVPASVTSSTTGETVTPVTSTVPPSAQVPSKAPPRATCACG